MILREGRRGSLESVEKKTVQEGGHQGLEQTEKSKTLQTSYDYQQISQPKLKKVKSQHLYLSHTVTDSMTCKKFSFQKPGTADPLSL